jgi:hypothetical protein
VCDTVKVHKDLTTLQRIEEFDALLADSARRRCCSSSTVLRAA